MKHYTLEQQERLKALGFNWNEKDQEWYSDVYEYVKRIYFDEGFNEYCLCTRFWNEDNQEYQDDWSYYPTLEEIFLDCF